MSAGVRPGLWWEHVEVHPDKGEHGEHANDNAGGAFGPVGGCEGLLDEGEFRVGMVGVGLLVFGGLMLVSFRRLGIREGW